MKEKPTKPEATKPSKPATPSGALSKKPTEEDVLKIMERLEDNGVVEFTSTLLRDKLTLDKESGRDIIRRIMKKLEADGKIVIQHKAFKGKRKRYVYRLKENK